MNNKILLVDDDVNHLNSFYSLYRKYFDITMSTSALESIEIMRSCEYSVIISDFKMKEVNGIDFLWYSREFCPNSVRMLLTGYADMEMAISVLNDNIAYKIITKPCKKKYLLEKLIEANNFYNKKILEEKLNRIINNSENINFLMKNEKIDITTLLDDIISSFRSKISYNNISVVVDYNIDNNSTLFDGYIVSDKIILNQLICNIFIVILDSISGKKILNIEFIEDGNIYLIFRYSIDTQDESSWNNIQLSKYDVDKWLMTYSVRLILEKLRGKMSSREAVTVANGVEQKAVVLSLEIPGGAGMTDERPMNDGDTYSISS